MSAGQLPPPGTVLRKVDRNGVVRCEAVVGEGGQVVYRGVTYSSISAAAKVAAGDIGLAARSCDGYAFFGLKSRDSVPCPARLARPLPLPLLVRWDDLPVASVSDHSAHGRSDESGAPRDPDCVCRGGADEESCADAGCGFCCVAIDQDLRMAVCALAPALVETSTPLEPVASPAPTPLEPVASPAPAPLEPVASPAPAPLEPVASPAPAPLEPVTALVDDRAAFDVNKVREELLAEIDTVLQETVYWQGGRLDTIKYLLARLEKAEAEAAVRGGETS